PSPSTVYDRATMETGFGADTGLVKSGRTRHPIVYSARGTHASYATPGAAGLHLNCNTDVAGAVDQTNKGTGWKTWVAGLVDADSEPWIYFGGRWGPVGSPPLGLPQAAWSGPVGP